MKLAERHFFELFLDVLDADPFGQRNIDIHGLAGYTSAFLCLRNVVKRAHVVHAVGQLDEQNADILGNREEKLAKIFGVPRVLGLQFQL